MKTTNPDNIETNRELLGLPTKVYKAGLIAKTISIYCGVVAGAGVALVIFAGCIWLAAKIIRNVFP